jgi:BMFP domain-containing protein YqiC
MRSVDAKDFSTTMQMLHEQVKGKLQESGQRYKKRVDLKRREVNFEVGDQVLAHLRRENIPKKII